MKRIVVTLAILTAFCVTLAFAQAGPKREEKKPPKPDTTSVAKPEKKSSPEKSEKAEKKEEKAEGEKKAEPEKKAAPEKKPAPAKKVEPEKKAEPAKKAEPEKKAEPAPRAEETPAPQAPPTTSPSVARAVLTGAMAGREPTAAIDTLTAPDDSLYFFTELVGLEGQTVTHRWKLNDQVMAEVPITVGAPHWRAYTKKRMIPAWAGTWTVEAVDADQRVLARRSFVYRVP